MTFDEYNMRLNNVIEAMKSEPNGVLMVKIASDALAMIRKRVTESGRNAEGGMYEKYSTRPYFTNCASMSTDACNQIAGSKEKRRQLDWATITTSSGKKVRMFKLPGGYKQFRELHGRQTGFVDFSFSGRMWANIKILSSFEEHQDGVARIGAGQQENKDKLAWNTDLKGDILKLSDEEIREIMTTYDMGIQQIFTKNGL